MSKIRERRADSTAEPTPAICAVGTRRKERRRLLAHVDTDETAGRADMPDLIRFALG
jgi:hypothetical protein